jgi:hypothetical protein
MCAHVRSVKFYGSTTVLAVLLKKAGRGTMSPHVISASARPNLRRLIAAFASRSCSAPHSLQIQCSTCMSSRPFGPVRQPSHEQICVDGWRENNGIESIPGPRARGLLIGRINQMRNFASLDGVHDCQEFRPLENEAATHLLNEFGIRHAAGSAEIFEDAPLIRQIRSCAARYGNRRSAFSSRRMTANAA